MTATQTAQAAQVQNFAQSIERTELENGFVWNSLSPRVATITCRHKPDFRIAYFAFATEAHAKAFWKYVTDSKLRAAVRPSERFGCGFEVKVWGMEKKAIAIIAQADWDAQAAAAQEERDYYHMAA